MGISDASRPIRCSSRERILIPHELAFHWPGSDSNKVEALALATALVTPPRTSLIGGTDSVQASDWVTHRPGCGFALTSSQTLNLTTCCQSGWEPSRGGSRVCSSDNAAKTVKQLRES